VADARHICPGHDLSDIGIPNSRNQTCDRNKSRPGVDAQTGQDGDKCADEPFHAIPNGGLGLCSRQESSKVLAGAEGAHEVDRNQNNGNARPDGGRTGMVPTKDRHDDECRYYIVNRLFYGSNRGG
jgi:hypothetical protein